MEEHGSGDAASGTAASDDAGASSVSGKLWLGLLALALSATMHGVDALVVIVAIPTISEELDAGLAGLHWVTAGYLLAYAATLITAGKLGDRYGHRRIFVAGMVGFMLSSAMAGLAGSIEPLIGWRVVQGACGAAMLASGLAIIRLIFPASKLKLAVGIFTGVFALSSAGGPFVGGVVVEYADWRWAFFINVIGGAITLVLVALLIPRISPQDARRGLDLGGMVLIAVALLGLVLGINQAPAAGWFGTVPLVCFGVAVVFVGWFVLHERRTPEPLIPLRLFRSRTFVTGNLLLLVGAGLMFGFWFHLSIFLQNVQGAGPLLTGLKLLPIAAVGVLAAPIGGALNQKVGPRPPLLAGALLFVVGLYGLSRIAPDASYHSIWPYLIALGISVSFIVPIATEAIIASAPKQLAGVASGFGETMGSLGPALGVATLGTVVTLFVRGDLSERLAGAGVSPETVDRVLADSDGIAQGAVAVPPGTPDSTGAVVAEQARVAFADGLASTSLVAMVLVVVCIPLVLLVKPATAASEEETAEASAAG